jgi:hypothetical protein
MTWFVLPPFLPSIDRTDSTSLGFLLDILIDSPLVADLFLLIAVTRPDYSFLTNYMAPTKRMNGQMNICSRQILHIRSLDATGLSVAVLPVPTGRTDYSLVVG